VQVNSTRRPTYGEFVFSSWRRIAVYALVVVPLILLTIWFHRHRWAYIPVPAGVLAHYVVSRIRFRNL
jgi:hypothetical protein